MKYYYKITHGFNAEDYIEINEQEVEKAFGAFLQKKDAVFSGGAIKGGMIQTIKPDFHRTMNWNRGYKLGEDDYAEISNKGIDRKMQNFISEIKERVQYLLSNKQENLIGKNIDLPEFPPKKEIENRGGMKSIGEMVN